MKKISILTVGIVLSLTVYSQNEKIDWDADLDYLAKELSEKHYNFFTVKSKDDFLSGINAIKQESANLTDFQVALKTQQLIAKFGDSHTMLNFTQLLNTNQQLPINLLWTSDGLHVLHTTPENEKILGCQVLSINNVPTTTVIDSLSTLFAVDNQAMIKSRIPQIIASLQILEYFGFANTEQVELGLKTGTNQNQSYILKQSVNQNNRVSIKPNSVAFSTKNKNQIFTDLYYPDENIYHILYNQCLGREIALLYGDKEMAENMPSFKEFEEKIFNTLTYESVQKIIFDMRYNSGGYSLQGTMFIERLAKFLKANPTIKTYVVLGRETFSSAILNTMDFKRLTNAIFVGEETAGKPNHFGDVRNFRLPTSNLSVNYSTKYFKVTDEDVNTITPDVKIEMSFLDLTKGTDPVYEWIKQQRSELDTTIADMDRIDSVKMMIDNFDADFKGPINGAFINNGVWEEKISVIYPTQDLDTESLKIVQNQALLVFETFLKSRGGVLLADTVALKTDLSEYGIMAYGTIESNLFLKQYAATFPFKIENQTIYADKEYTDKDIKFISCVPNPHNKAKGMSIYTALSNKNIQDINNVSHGGEDYILFLNRETVISKGFYKKDGNWTF